ncbi:MAG: hypothetical protein LBD41_05550, partial [Clostridiales Family XIII bacterium]|nr:hypothetical protein [Clostridiales Family XIII bacterium]
PRTHKISYLSVKIHDFTNQIPRFYRHNSPLSATSISQYIIHKQDRIGKKSTKKHQTVSTVPKQSIQYYQSQNSS